MNKKLISTIVLLILVASFMSAQPEETKNPFDLIYGKIEFLLGMILGNTARIDVLEERVEHLETFLPPVVLGCPTEIIEIMDVVPNPTDTVLAGRALLVKVRVKNTGLCDAESIKVTVDVLELAVSASDYIDEILIGDAENSEELYLRIPACAEAGQYILKTVVAYNEGADTVQRENIITVLEGEPCGV